MKKEDLILIGAGGHADACADLVNSTKKFNIRAIVGTKKDFNKIVLKNLKVKYSDKDLNSLSKKYKNALISVGQIRDYQTRLRIFKKLKKLFIFI